MLIRSFAGATARLAFAVFAISALNAAAEAATLITYVASDGVDTRPCNVVTAPCKTLQRAVNVTSANGMVEVLTPLLGGASIAKSITIEGGGAAIVGQITISSASAVVTLRGLALNGAGTVASGVKITSAAAVHIEDSTVERYTSDGIKLVATTATELFISNTAVHATSSDGLYADATNAQVVIQNSSFDQNGSTGVYLHVAKANVTRSSASGNAQHGFILLSSIAKITETAADNNKLGDGFAVRAGYNFLSSAEASDNGLSGLHIEAGVAETNDCVFLGGGGVGVRNQGIWYTRENNSVTSHTGGSPAPSGAL